MSRKIFLSSLFGLVLAILMGLFFYGRAIWFPVYQKIKGQQTLQSVVAEYGEPARLRLKPNFDRAGVTYPPIKITLLGIKDKAKLELWAETVNGPKHIHTYEIKALSGTSGPKLREGDKQVPEGFYGIEGLNPNSTYHLSMKLNYPNTFDSQQAAIENRTSPGSNIFIHGKAVSIGCLAMGDTAIEELFILATDIGIANIKIAIAPSDPRKKPLPTKVSPQWLSVLYKRLTHHFNKYQPLNRVTLKTQ
jgi:hypothetical protein